jgi:hypothetical protein
VVEMANLTRWSGLGWGQKCHMNREYASYRLG